MPRKKKEAPLGEAPAPSVAEPAESVTWLGGSSACFRGRSFAPGVPVFGLPADLVAAARSKPRLFKVSHGDPDES